MHPFKTYCGYGHSNRLRARFCTRCGLGVTPGWKWMLEDLLWFLTRIFSSPVALAVLAAMAMMVVFAVIVVLAVLA